jgi:uncharacterized protein (TIGR03118 family)
MSCTQVSRPVQQAVVDVLESRTLFAAALSFAAAAPASDYTEVNLVSDVLPAAFTDANLVNAWGLASAPNGPFWAANNGTGTATVYNGHGEKQAVQVTIPPLAGSAVAPVTGEVFNGTASFTVTSGANAAPAVFIWATEDGRIAAWNPTVNPDTAVIVSDRSASGAVYKGLAIASSNGQDFVYATDFFHKKVVVFDTNFNRVQLAGNFTDPNLPARFSPFGITQLNGQIYVSYARRNDVGHDDLAGAHRGFVDVFNTDGTFVQRLVTRGALNSPWGMVQAPADFGAFSNALLVGNFGNGMINAFDINTGQQLGRLRHDGVPIVVHGVWGLEFGNGSAASGATNQLFFNAGPNGEADGLFGLIGLTTPPAVA